MSATIQQFQLNNPVSYETFFNITREQAEQGRTSGASQDTLLVESTRLNAQRMKRIDKQFEITPEVQEVLAGIDRAQKWIVITETWCGDSAQILPFIGKMAAASARIELQIILRDENLDFMDQYLTNGRSRSIPKLVSFDAASGEELASWGPRPKLIQDQIDVFMKANPDASHEELVKEVHTWYAQDKGQAIISELKDFILKTGRTAIPA